MKKTSRAVALRRKNFYVTSVTFLCVFLEIFRKKMNEQAPILVELQYLPPLAYFVLLQSGRPVLLDVHEHYVKQTYRNRCYIKGPHQLEKLTVPVLGGSKKIRTSEIKIDYRQKWVLQHWRSLQAAYGKAPFFEHYAPYFEAVYQQEAQNLWELNLRLLTLCLKLLQLKTTIRFTDTYLESTNSLVLDFRNRISPKKTAIVEDIYRPVPYNQIFGKDFAYNLSIVDLLFCEGPAAKIILQNSAAKGLNI